MNSIPLDLAPVEQADGRLRFLPLLTRFRFYFGASENCQARCAIQENSMIAPQTPHVKPLAMALLYPVQDWHAVAPSILCAQSMCWSVDPESWAPSCAPCQCHRPPPPPAVVALACAPSTPLPTHRQQLDALSRAPLSPYHRAVGAFAHAPRTSSCTDCQRCQPRDDVVLARTSSTPSSAHHVEACCP